MSGLVYTCTKMSCGRTRSDVLYKAKCLGNNKFKFAVDSLSVLSHIPHALCSQCNYCDDIKALEFMALFAQV